MKTILCYGDSNTWGYNPAKQERYPLNVRWPGVLREELGEGYWVIEEGQNGRTTVWNDPIESYRNGKHYLIPCLETHCPLDLVILMLGTNDLKRRFSLASYDIARGISVLIDIIHKSNAGLDSAAPRVLLLAPPPLGRLADEEAKKFEGAEVKSRLLAKYYAQVTQEHRCVFLDTSEVITSSDIDGVHLEASEHHKLGLIVAVKVKDILKINA